MSKRTPYVRVVVIAILAIAGGFFLTYRGKSQSENATFTPFVAQIVVKHFGQGNSVVPGAITYITLARKRDGSTARFATVHSPDGLQVAQIVDIIDVASSKQIELEPFTKSVSTYYVTQKQLNDLMQAQEACPENVGRITKRSSLLGYQVYRLHSSHQYKGITETDDQWVAPDLACLPLQETYTVSSGPRNEKAVVSLTVEDPPASMFKVPPGYTERSPTEVAAAWTARFPGYVFMPHLQVKLLDERYYAHR